MDNGYQIAYWKKTAYRTRYYNNLTTAEADYMALKEDPEILTICLYWAGILIQKFERE